MKMITYTRLCAIAGLFLLLALRLPAIPLISADCQEILAARYASESSRYEFCSSERSRYYGSILFTLVGGATTGAVVGLLLDQRTTPRRP
jgi:hypothetical protein